MNKKVILVQAGHIAPRDPNHMDETGAGHEQELVREIRNKLVSMLAKDGRFKVLPMPGYIPHGIKCDAAVFLHADGSEDKTDSGYSLGFPEFPINVRLARLISEEIQRIPGHPPHHRDNYTGGMRDYYGYNRVDTPGPEVLVEHGFVSNPKERAWLFAHTDALANAEYNAILRFFALKAKVPARKGQIIHITDKDGSEYTERGNKAEATARFAQYMSGKYKGIEFDRA